MLQWIKDYCNRKKVIVGMRGEFQIKTLYTTAMHIPYVKDRELVLLIDNREPVSNHTTHAIPLNFDRYGLEIETRKYFDYSHNRQEVPKVTIPYNMEQPPRPKPSEPFRKS